MAARARKPGRFPGIEPCVDCAEAAEKAQAAEQVVSDAGNQAFGRALEASRLIPAGQQSALFAALQPPAAVAGVRMPADRGLEPAEDTGSPTVDTAAVAARVVEAARHALAGWAARAVIVGVTVSGPTARGGTLVGPPLGSLLPAPAAAGSAAEQGVEAEALAAFAAAFDAWCAQFTIPDVPLWPTLAAIPAPEAPPTPSDPVSLATLAPASLSIELSGGRDAAEDAALQEAGAALLSFFGGWKGARTVNDLVATGTVPNHSPPFCPVGPACGTAGGEPGMIS